MWTFIDDAPSAVEFMMAVTCLLAGLSHLLQPRMWADFFAGLEDTGTRGLVLKLFAIELWPATLVVTLHQVWWGPGIVLTVYGWLLLAKVATHMLAPAIGMRSMANARRGDNAFRAAGVMLLVVSGASAMALVWPG